MRSSYILPFGLVLAGCNSTPAVHFTAAPLPAPTSSWVTVADEEDGITVNAPGGWKRLKDASSSDVPGMAPDEGQNNPQVQGLMNDMAKFDQKIGAEEEANLRKKNVIFTVVDTSAKPIIGEERTRFYIHKKTRDGNATLDDAAADEKEFLTNESAAKDIDLPIGKAKEFHAEVTTKGGDKVNRVSYVMVDGKDSYALRFVSTNNPQGVESIAAEVAKSLRIRPGK